MVLLLMIVLISGFIIGKELLTQKNAQKRFKQLSESAYDEATGHNLQELFKKNKDCIGWVSIKGTVIDYPVMHTPKDNKKYLYKDFEQNYSSSGTPFLDGRCTINSDNCIIYGHNMRNGLLFASLRKYVDSSYCKKHPEILFETTNGNNKYKIFAVVRIKENDEWYDFVDAPNENKFKEYVEKLKEKALYSTEDEVEYGTQILTLSTCYGQDKADRLIVVGTKIKENE